MAEMTYREAHAVLTNFASNFAAPVVAILPVLEKAKDAEGYLAMIEPQYEAVKAQLEDALHAVEQAQIDKQTVLDSIEHDRATKQEDANRQLEAYRAKVQIEIDALATTLQQTEASTANEVSMLQQQIEDRKAEQRDLDAAINQKRLVLADLSGKLLKAATAVQ